MDAATFSERIYTLVGHALASTVFSPAAIVPSLGIAVLTYLLVSRQLDLIQDDTASPEEFGTAGEANEWLGGPTSEWLGI